MDFSCSVLTLRSSMRAAGPHPRGRGMKAPLGEDRALRAPAPAYSIRLPYPRRITSSAGLPFGVNPESSAPPRVRSVGHFQK